MNLSWIIAARARSSPTKTAIVFEGRTITYGQLARRVQAGAMALKRSNVRRGDRVAVLARNLPSMLEILFACTVIGASFVPINWRLRRADIKYVLDDCVPKVLACDNVHAELVDPGWAPHLWCLEEGVGYPWVSYNNLLSESFGQPQEPQPTSLQDPICILYTAGTTGRSKGVLLSQSNVLWNAVNSRFLHGLTGNDHVLTVIPLFHTGGLNIQTIPALFTGATITLHRGFDSGSALTAIDQEKPTLTVLVPSQMASMLDDPRWDDTELTSLRYVVTGSSVVPSRLIEAFHKRGVKVGQVYGATETGPVSICLRAADAVFNVGAAGKPALYCDVKLVDPVGEEIEGQSAGEILLKGPAISCGYWKESQRLEKDWFSTGDMARRDINGFYYVTGRIKDLIISGGENVSAAEVEQTLCEHNGVVEAAVIGLPHQRWIEVPAAVVVVSKAATTETSLIAHCTDRLASFKVPKRIFFIEALPRNAMGKVEKYKLREQFC